jgi:phenylacetate-CoA ligase
MKRTHNRDIYAQASGSAEMAGSGMHQTFEQFLTTSIEDHFQNTEGLAHEKSRVELFHETAELVPAYNRFLFENGVDPHKIASAVDLQKLPAVTRDNYISRHPLPDLCRNGRLEDCDMIAVSSGSTGIPTFWPRALSDEVRTAWRFEQVFHDSFHANQRRTLAVICFSLGTWVGGMYTAGCCRHLAAKGYPITVVTPGNNLTEIFRVVQDLGQWFDQTVLLGYPPFLKDVIDTGLSRGVPWPRYGIKFVLAGEVFSEEWRSLVAERVGSHDICFDSASLYGTADAGVLANETGLSICIRRFLARNPDVARELFGESRLPTLVQYDPSSRFFEVEENRLLFTGDNGIPLIRYNILDTGGIIGFEEMLELLNMHGFDAIGHLNSAETSSASARTPVIRRLPFVYVFGRSSFAVSYYGANVYPENIAVGLEQDGIKEWVTGKFVLQVLEDTEHNRRLSVTIELAPDVSPSQENQSLAAASIETHLIRLNSEFANYVPGQHRTPVVLLKEAGDPVDFPIGVKHRYTRS